MLRRTPTFEGVMVGAGDRVDLVFAFIPFSDFEFVEMDDFTEAGDRIDLPFVFDFAFPGDFFSSISESESVEADDKRLDFFFDVAVSNAGDDNSTEEVGERADFLRVSAFFIRTAFFDLAILGDFPILTMVFLGFLFLGGVFLLLF